jgi:hypothetical protein
MFRELEQAYSTKQVALSVYSQKAQETVDKIFQVRYLYSYKFAGSLL